MNDRSQTFVSSKANIGQRVRIGHGTKIYDNVEVDDDCIIGDFCSIGIPAGGKWEGLPLKLGKKSIIRSHSAIYEGSKFSQALETGHYVLIREGTSAGENLRVGSHSDVEGNCSFGDFCRLHSYAHVGRGSMVGDFVWIYSLVTLTNDPLPPSHLSAPVVIEDGVVVCVGATLLPGTRLGRGSFVCSQSSVSGEFKSGVVINGNPGRAVSHVAFLRNLEHGLQHPWMNHFANAYPPHVHGRIAQLREAILASRENLEMTKEKHK